MSVGARPFCAAPWQALTVDMTGEIVPDVIFQESWGNIFSSSLGEIWAGARARETRAAWLAGETPRGCAPCLKKERSIGSSRRLFFQSNELIDVTRGELAADAAPDIRFLEVNLSNLCNLKCRMCSAVQSTAWVAEEEQLRALGRSYHRMQGFQGAASGLARLSPDQLVDRLFAEPAHFRNLRHICLRGGEPMLEKANLRFLRRLNELGLPHPLTIDVSTNGSVVNEEFMALLRGHRVKLHVSLEGTGELYGYVRGGDKFSLADLEGNLERLDRGPDARFIFAVTVMTYNIFDIENIWRWFARVRRPHHEIYFRNIVVQPPYLHPHILPAELRRAAAERILAAGIPDRTENPRQGRTGVQELVSSLTREMYADEEARELRAQFRQFTEDVDRLRGTSITRVVPELAPLFAMETNAEAFDKNLLT